MTVHSASTLGNDRARIFLMTSNANADKVAEEVKKSGLKAELIQSNLSEEQADKLRKTFSDAE